MNKVYTITNSVQDDAITLSDDNLQISIVFQEYSDEKYNEFLDSLNVWDLLLIDDSWDEEGIGTAKYCSKEYSEEAILPLKPHNILVNNDEVIGFVLGAKHYPKWKTPDDTVLMFIDGTSIGRTEHECSYLWGDYPSDTTFYHDHYIYKLVKRTSFD